MIRPKKSLGQNFLIDKNVIKKILLLSKINNCFVVEIGPGTGNLTEQILNNNPANLILIEKDTTLAKILEKKYIDDSRVKVFNKDILSFNTYSGIKLGPSYKTIYKDFVTQTTLDLSSLVNKWEKSGALKNLLELTK